MSRKRGLEKLEGRSAAKCLFIVGGDLAACERKIAKMKASGEWPDEPVQIMNIITGVPRADDED